MGGLFWVSLIIVVVMCLVIGFGDGGSGGGGGSDWPCNGSSTGCM